jgi:hypothetical protein
MPNFGVIYAALFEEYRQKVNGFHFSMRDLKTREQASMGLDDYSCSFGSEVDAERVIGMAQEKIFRQLIYAAQKQFAPPGGLLSIDEFATKRVCGMYNTENRLDFVKVWAYLEETYGGDRGVEEAWRQAAKALGKEFGLSRDTAVEVRGGKTILHIRIYIDSFDKKNGKNKISYTCCERIGHHFPPTTSVCFLGRAKRSTSLPRYRRQEIEQSSRGDR